MKNKNDVLDDFIEMMKSSWTYEKMTNNEKIKLIDVLNDVRTQEALKGTYYNRWHILQAIYHSYLIGIGYTDFNWRDKNDSK